MVQRKVSSKLGIQVEHVKSDKRLANMKLSSSSSSSHQHLDGKTKVSDMKKKMKKSKSIKLSDLETLQSSPSSVPSSTKAAPASPQKQHPLVRTTPDGSPNYMKPTSSSHAKKELFSVSLRKTQSGSDFNRKFSSDSKAMCKKPTKALIRSTGLSLVRTLTKTTSFKASRTSCPRKSTRATCSSTLKDSSFPSYLMLNHGGTELEGTSVMKVCSYTYCSLNGHPHHADLPPLKTFMSSRRRVLKRVKLEALSPRSRRLKATGETEMKDSDVEKSAFDSKPSYDETAMDFFIEIYANEKKDEESTGEEIIEKTNFLEEVEDHGDIIKSTIENDGIEVGFLKEVEDLKKNEDVDKDQQTSWSHEEISLEDVHNNMDDSDSGSEDMHCDEEQYYGYDHENYADSSVYTDEENDSKTESLSESSHDVSVTWLDDILSSYYDDIILVDETLKETKSEEIIYLEDQPHNDMISFVLEDKIGSNETQEIGYSSDDIGCDQSSLANEIFDYLTNAEENVDETSQENEDDNINIEDKHEVQLFDVLEGSIKDIQDQCKGNKRASCIIDEDEDTRGNRKGVIRRKRNDEDDDELRNFNPREPNFLPLVPEKEKEKVDLRHQMMDERKNAEDWMVDCALRQAVNKLAPARKKKVALLVEAFETVIPKCESHLRNKSGFSHGRHIQACS